MWRHVSQRLGQRRLPVPTLFTRAQSGEAAEGVESTRGAGLSELYMRALEPKVSAPVPVMTDAERSRGAALHRTYVQLLWKRERVQGRDLNRKLKLKWAAIHALPTLELRKAALVVSPFVPLRLSLAGISPPLKGFHVPSAAVAAAAIASSESAGAAGSDAADGAVQPSSGAPAAPWRRQPMGGANTSALAALAAARRKASAGGPSLLSTLRRDATGAVAPSGGVPASGSKPAPSAVPASTPAAASTGKER